MTQLQHKYLAAGRWNEMSLVEQMTNIGSEVIRSIKWKNKGNQDLAHRAFVRALELFDLSLRDPKNSHRLKEVARSREVFVGFFIDEDPYKTTGESLEKYFLSFNYLVQR